MKTMILSKKPGPPVPPRPSANSLAKSQSTTTVMLPSSASSSSSSASLPHGRTVIYKSPSYFDIQKRKDHDENDDHKHHNNNDLKNNKNKDNNNENCESNRKHDKVISVPSSSTPSSLVITTITQAATTTTTATTSVISCTTNDVINTTSSNEEAKSNNKTEIIILNNNLINLNNHSNKIEMQQHQQNNVILVDREKDSNENALQLSSSRNGCLNGNHNNVEIYHDDDDDDDVENNVINKSSCENSHQQKFEIKQKSPVAKPRQNAPSKRLYKFINNENVESMSMSSASSTDSSITNSSIVSNENQSVDMLLSNDMLADGVVVKNNINNSNVEAHNKKLVTSLSSTKRSSAPPLLPMSATVTALKERNNENRIIEINKSNTSTIERTNNLKNSTNFNVNAEKLFTEIIINSESTKAINCQTKLEHCIKVRTPSPLRSVSAQRQINKPSKLPFRPEPEGDEQIDLKYVEEKATEKKVTFHEMLISELAAMHKTDDISAEKKNRRRYPSSCSTDSSPNGTHRSRIRTSDWVEVGDNGKEVLLSSCQISLEDSGLEDEERGLMDDMSSGVGDSWDSGKDLDESMSLPGLPPLPKSLSGLELTGVHQHNAVNLLDSQQRGVSPLARKPSTLDTQLAILRREMFGLRQLDLSLLSQLWALNESIQEFRTIIQEQETLSPPSPSPSPSDTNSLSSGDEGDSTQDSHHQLTAIQMQQQKQQLLLQQQQQQQQQQLHQQRMRAAPPPPPPNHKAPSSRPV